MSPLGELAVRFCVYAALCGLTAILAQEFLNYGKKLRIPRVGKDPKKVGVAAVKADFLANGHKLLEDGYSKVR